VVLELRRRPELWALGAVLVGGALLRFATLAEQSLWYDEVLTWQLVTKPFGEMVQAVVDTENTPPLFYAATHVSTKVAGTGEVGLRLVSALAGTLTIAVAFVAGRELAGRRAGVIAGGLVAVNPFLFYFSQDARAYALVTLLSAIALVCFLRVIEGPPRLWALAGWVVSSAAALATHYFAIFPMAAEAAWILAVLARLRLWRALAFATAAAAAAVAAIAPLAIEQEASGRAENILVVPLAERIAQVPKHFLAGYFGPSLILLAVISALLLVVATSGLWRIRRRRAVVATVTVAVAAVVVPMAAAVVGVDFLNSRNALPGLVPVLVLAGAGFAALPAPIGVGGAAALAAAGVVATAGVIADPAYQRTNWRGIDAAVGDSRDRRLLVVSPFNGEVALRAYRAGIEPAHLPQRVREVLVAGAATQVSGDRNAPPRPEPPVLPGFTLVGRDLDSTYTLYRYRAPQRVPVPPGTTVRVQLGDPSSLVIVPPSDSAAER
jgi:4-amino-4-deoxy-L-arabinose transferase-like glycosyltransferase